MIYAMAHQATRKEVDTKMSADNTFSIVSSSVSETERCGFELARSLHGRSFVALYGDLGMGKTAFVRGMAKALCPDAAVQSPTYTVINEYKKGGRSVLVHVDAYRIRDDDDLYSTGFYDCAEYEDCVMAVEWCENIPFAVPRDAITVKIEPLGDTQRRITVEGSDISL